MLRQDEVGALASRCLLGRSGVRTSSSAAIAMVGVEFVAHGWFEPLGQCLGARQVRGNEDHAVGRFETGARQVDHVARRRRGDRRRFGFRLTMVAGLSRNCHKPAAPIAMKGIFETTFQKFGMPATARQSANRW
jgi:hypothetical protein